MKIDIHGTQIIEKLEKRLLQEIQKNVMLEATVEALQKELQQSQEDSTLKIE